MIKAYPDLADPVVGDEDPAVLMERRRLENRACMACGKPANAALTGTTTGGERFIDVCWDCYVEIQRGSVSR